MDANKLANLIFELGPYSQDEWRSMDRGTRDFWALTIRDWLEDQTDDLERAAEILKASRNSLRPQLDGFDQHGGLGGPRRTPFKPKD